MIVMLRKLTVESHARHNARWSVGVFSDLNVEPLPSKL